MLTYLRKLRKSIIGSGSAGRYLIYAVGEIALVVIGILIALQINNWNERQKDRDVEIKMYREIHAELVETRDELQGDLEDIERNLRWTEQARKIMIERIPYSDSIWFYFYGLLDTEQFQPKSSAFESLKSLGLNYLSNDTLRHQITDLYQLRIARLSDPEGELSPYLHFEDVFYPLIQKHLVIDPAVLQDSIWMRRSMFPHKFLDYNDFLNDRELLNRVQWSMSWRRRVLRNHRVLARVIDRTMKNISEEIERIQS